MFERFTDRARRVVVLAQEELVKPRAKFVHDQARPLGFARVGPVELRADLHVSQHDAHEPLGLERGAALQHPAQGAAVAVGASEPEPSSASLPVSLSTLNVSNNNVSHLRNVARLVELQTLQASNCKLKTLESLEELRACA